MAKARSGGGIQSNKVTRPVHRGGPPHSNVVSPAGVRQLGNTVEPETLEKLQRGTARHEVPLGNALTNNVGGGGPGTGRTVMPSGSQGFHGSAVKGEAGMSPDAPATQGGRDILSDFGPERRNR